MNRTIKSGARKIIYKVFLQCLKESEAGQILSDIENAFQRTADMTGVSVNTVKTIANEGQNNNEIFSTPGKHRTGRPKKKLDNFTLCAIRQKVHFFYTVKKQAAAEKAFQSISVDDWKNCCRHVKKIEEEYYERGRKLYTDIESFVINVQDNSSSSDSSESEDDYYTENSRHNAEFSGVEYLDEDILESEKFV
ncbi:hypothetical protein ACJJTC_006975 [Scirpophaga incertulas]